MLTTAPRRKRMAPSAHGGFTLIELMVTIALLAILVTLSLPSFTSWIRNSQVRTVAEALQGGMRTAQAEALRRNRQIVMSFTDASPVLDAVAKVDGKNWTLHTVAQFGETKEFIAGGSLVDSGSSATITSGVSAICFNASGRLVTNTSDTGITDASCAAAATAFNVAQGGADRNLRVVLQLGGQMRMCDPKRPTLSDSSPDGCPASPT